MKEPSIHETALLDPTTVIGDGSRVGAFTKIEADVSIGSHCDIQDQVFIQDSVTIGDRVVIHHGVQLWRGFRIEDDVRIGPNATFSNDKFIAPADPDTVPPITVVKRGAAIGANATILPGLTIHGSSVVGAGAVVTRDVPPKAIVAGNPARILGYVDTSRSSGTKRSPTSSLGVSHVKGVQVYELKHVTDMRGDLIVTELEKDLPFVPKRVFLVHDVPSTRAPELGANTHIVNAINIWCVSRAACRSSLMTVSIARNSS